MSDEMRKKLEALSEEQLEEIIKTLEIENKKLELNNLKKEILIKMKENEE